MKHKMIVLDYYFEYCDDEGTSYGGFEFQYAPDSISECIDEWFEQDREDNCRDMVENGYNPNDRADLIEWAQECDDFWEFAHDKYRDVAYEEFRDSPELQEMIKDANDYDDDPYSYNGVSRSDFH